MADLLAHWLLTDWMNDRLCYSLTQSLTHSLRLLAYVFTYLSYCLMDYFWQVLVLPWWLLPSSVASTTMWSWRGHFITCLLRLGVLYRGKHVIRNGVTSCASMLKLLPSSDTHTFLELHIQFTFLHEFGRWRPCFKHRTWSVIKSFTTYIVDSRKNPCCNVRTLPSLFIANIFLPNNL